MASQGEAKEGDEGVSSSVSQDEWHDCTICAIVFKTQTFADGAELDVMVNERTTPAPSVMKLARQLLELTQAEMAAIAGISLRSMVDLESEARRPMRATLERVRIGLETRGARFFSDGGKMGVYVRRIALPEGDIAPQPRTFEIGSEARRRRTDTRKTNER